MNMSFTELDVNALLDTSNASIDSATQALNLLRILLSSEYEAT
jgi:hypothetical protein